MSDPGHVEMVRSWWTVDPPERTAPGPVNDDEWLRIRRLVRADALESRGPLTISQRAAMRRSHKKQEAQER